MCVIGNIIRDRRDLRFGARVAPEREIEGRVEVGDALRNAALAIFSGRIALGVGQRPVVLHDPFERFPGQVQPVEAGIAPVHHGHGAQGLGIVVEAAEVPEAGIERPLAGVPERRVAEVMGERERLGEVLIERQGARERAGDLGDFQGVGQAGAVVVALVEHEHLGLVLEAAERGRVDDPVGIAAERAAGRALGLGMEPPPARRRIGRVRRASRHLGIPQLTWAVAVPNYPSR